VAFLLRRVTSWTAFTILPYVPLAVFIAISLACPTSIPLWIAFVKLKLTPSILKQRFHCVCWPTEQSSSVQSGSSCTMTSELNFPLYQDHALLLASNGGMRRHHAAYFRWMIPSVNAARAGGLGGTVRLIARIARCLNSTCFRRSKYLVRPGPRGPYFSPFSSMRCFLTLWVHPFCLRRQITHFYANVRRSIPEVAIFFPPFCRQNASNLFSFPLFRIIPDTGVFFDGFGYRYCSVVFF